MSELSQQLFTPHKLATWLVNDSETLPHAWLYSDESPPTNWAQPDFDDSAWLSADAPLWQRRQHAVSTGEPHEGRPDLVEEEIHAR